MKQKIVGICIMGLFLAIAVLPAVGTMNEQMEIKTLGAQQPEIEWMKTFNRGEFDYFHYVRPTSDGGYIATGATEENDMYYVWLVKLDASGAEDWMVINYDLNASFMSGAETWANGFDVQQTSDNGYIVCGPSMAEYDIDGTIVWLPTGYIWKTDQNGNTEWLHHYYALEEEIIYWPFSIIEKDDAFITGGFALYYDASSGTVVDQDGFIMKTDISGNILWKNEFDAGGTDTLSSVAQTSDGGYILSGYTDNSNVMEGALWMVETDSSGNKQWDKFFDGPGFEYTFGKGCCQTNDGGYIMSGVSNSYGHGGTDIWAIKTDASGNIDWDVAYGGEKNDYSWGMCNADSNGFAFGIVTNYGAFTSDKDDILVIETDNEGHTEWKLLIEEDGSQITRSICQTDDGGYIFSAMTGSLGSSRTDGIILKIASFDNNRPLKPEIDGKSKGKPNKEYTFSATCSDPDDDSLLYKWDWGDGNVSEWLASADATHTWTTENNFEVLVMTQDEHGGESEWSDPLPFSTPKNKIYLLYLRWIEMIYNKFPVVKELIES